MTSDKISCRLKPVVVQALQAHMQDDPRVTVSSVVDAALRAYLGIETAPVTAPDVWEAIAAIHERLEALEASRPPVRSASAQPNSKPPAPAAERPQRASIDGLLTDAQVAEILGRSKGGFQNSVRALELTDGDTYEGFRVVGKVADPKLGGPPRRVWERVT